YIPGPEYPEYLPPADDELPAEEQPLPAALSPTADSISASEDSDKTEPFEEGETVATPPPSAYRVAAKISVRPHIPTPFRSESEVERLLAIPTPPLSPVSPTSYPLPPFLMPLPIFTPLPPPPILLPRTRASMVLTRSAAPSTFILAPRSRTPSIGTPPLLPILLPTSSFPLPFESVPEADMPLRKRARFTTPTGRYKVGESSVAATARQIRPALTVDDSRRAEDRLIGRLRRERRYFRTLSTTYAREDSGFELTGFSDADYAGCKDTFKSTSGGAQFLGEKLVSWSSKKQDCTALSTAEAEYVSLSACCAQVLWMRTQLTDYGFHYIKIPIYCDSKSVIAISCNPVQHSRTKHIVVRYHFIKKHVEKVDRFNYLVRRLGMRSLSPQELDRLAKSQ
nr:retrovirus-related Pol polyprotein from transposon TNT 1-94 [Tanacetum cinerariifolium]